MRIALDRGKTAARLALPLLVALAASAFVSTASAQGHGHGGGGGHSSYSGHGGHGVYGGHGGGYGHGYYGGRGYHGGGRWVHNGYGGHLGWWWLAGGVWYLRPPAVYVQAEPYVYDTPPAVVSEGALSAPPATWYYCDSAAAYYPYVSTCPAGWRAVPATPRDAEPAVQPAVPSSPPPRPAQ